MGDQKAYYFGQIESAAGAHRTTVNEVQALQEELRGHMNRLSAAWTSDSASPAQQQAHATWASTNDSVNQICAQRGQAVGNAGQRMSETERSNANLFA